MTSKQQSLAKFQIGNGFVEYGMPEFDYGRWKLEWDHIGEGFQGDYDPEDPEDVRLYRANLYYWVDNTVEPDFYPLDDASFCTTAPVGTPTRTLQWLSEMLFRGLPKEITVEDPYQLRLPRQIMAGWLSAVSNLF